jgi:two-component system nitrogen regulation response regulator GlnG
MDGTILIADDDKTIRTVLSQALTRAGCKVKSTASLTTLERWINEGIGNVVISDVIMPDGNGLELLPEIRKIRPDLPVIIISAQNTLTTAIKAEEGKAFDYLPKPFDLPDLLKKVSISLKTKEKSSKTRLPELNEELPLIGSSKVMLDLYREIAKLMNKEDPVLIIGESGSGKTLIAETLHNFSDRRNLPLIKMSMDFFSEYEKCIDQIELGKGGTILIEDLNSFEIKQQEILTRLLDHNFRNNPRFLVTNKSSSDPLKQSNLIDPSLLFRLNRYTINVPALRFRISDIDELITSYIKKSHNSSHDSTIFEDGAIDLLKDYYWPGNVLQLNNVLAYLLMHETDKFISKNRIRKSLDSQPKFGVSDEVGKRLSDIVEYHVKKYFDRHGGLLPPKGVYQRIIKELETPIIEVSLRACKGNQLKCAELLGLNRNTLRKKVKNINIDVAKYKKMM